MVGFRSFALKDLRPSLTPREIGSCHRLQPGGGFLLASSIARQLPTRGSHRLKSC